jgi:hypothetical protein
MFLLGFRWKKVEKLMRDKESMKRLLDKDMVYEKYLQSGLAIP